MAIFPVAAIVEQSLGSDETYEILLPGRIDGMLNANASDGSRPIMAPAKRTAPAIVTRVMTLPC